MFHFTGFERKQLELEEPESEGVNLNIPIVRLGGTVGVVKVTWQAMYKGEINTNNIKLIGIMQEQFFLVSYTVNTTECSFRKKT